MPRIQLPHIIMRAWKSPAMYKVIWGGRGSAKSGSVARICLMDCQAQSHDVLCGREYQNSIDDSVHKLLKNLIYDKALGISGYDVTDRRITCTENDKYFAFKGFARNPQNIKSAEDFGRCWMEEAQSASQATLDDLLPTIRGDGSQIYFTLNPQSSEDPISKRFLLPFMDEVIKNGYYEDDMHHICQINWRDNPFWNAELEKKRLWDFENKPRAYYDWVWEGGFNDSVESPLILPEWFDACVDAHVKLGFEPRGIRIAAHDPSDTGPDNKGYAMRWGSVFLDIQEKEDGDINDGADWAAGIALTHGLDYFTWDVGGLAGGLKTDFAKAFEGKPTVLSMFNGAETVDNPNAIYEPCPADASEATIIEGQKTNKESIKNKRAQYYTDLRKRVYNTYKAVTTGEYHDPDTMISFSSKIKILRKVRSELCRMPIKPNRNNLVELYTKEEMLNKFKVPSPNCGDSVMMALRVPPRRNQAIARRPKPIPRLGRRR